MKQRSSMALLGLLCGLWTAGASAEAPSEVVSLARLKTLALLATGQPLSAQEEKRLQAGLSKERLPEFVRGLMGKEEAARYAPNALFPAEVRAKWTPFQVIDYGFDLKTFEHEGQEIYFLYARCDPKTAVSVRPWWDLESEVLVCPDSYKPELEGIEFDPKHTAICGGRNRSSYSKDCGCGPALMNCSKGFKFNRKIFQSTQDEFSDTVAHVAKRDVPLSTMFTMNESVRDRTAEFFYARWRIQSGEDPKKVFADLARWPKEGAKLAKRPNLSHELHAGVLTTHHLLYLSSGPRERIQQFSDVMWCIEPVSVRVEAEKLFDLVSTNFREMVGWEKLANAPGCETCHARIDYGVRFFSEFPSIQFALGYWPHYRVKGRGPMYIDDKEDHRGDEELTPSGFARLAIRQPEFEKCMISRVTRHVFGRDSLPADIEAVQKAYQENSSYKNLMTTALVRFGLGAPRPKPKLEEEPQVSSSSDGPIALDGKLGEMIENECIECHAVGDDDVPSFAKESVTRKMMMAMLDEVAARQMPKRAVGMHPANRAAMMREMIKRLWKEGPKRQVALGHLTGEALGVPVVRPDAVHQLLVERSKADPEKAGRSILLHSTLSADREVLEYNSGFSIAVALDGLNLCKSAGHQGAELDACLDRILDPKNVVIPLRP